MNNEKTTAAGKKQPPRKKKSSFRTQVTVLIIIAVIAIITGVVLGVTMNYLNSRKVYLDSFTESRKTAAGETFSYTYQSMKQNGKIVIVNEKDETLPFYYINEDGKVVAQGDTDSPPEDSILIFQTEIGTMLRLSDSGTISSFAQVDYNGSVEVGETGTYSDNNVRVLIFPRVDQGTTASILIHHKNKDGSITEFRVIGKDTADDSGKKDGLNDLFYIEGYDKATVNPVISASMCSFAGYTLAQKKFSTSVMASIDRENAGKEGYKPLIGEDGRIRFDEYGLGDDCDTYYEITSTDGKSYRLYFGSKTPDGGSYYVRYSDSEEGDRNAVYKVSDDPGVSTALNIKVSRSALLMGEAKDLVYPQLTYPSTLTTFLTVHNFALMKADRAAEGGFTQVVGYTYKLLSERMNTIDQTTPYYVTLPGSVMKGYRIDGSRVDESLGQLYDIVSIMNNTYNTTSKVNYVKVRRLVTDIIGKVELPTMTDYAYPDKYVADYNSYTKKLVAAIDHEVANNISLRAMLSEYGLDKPAYKVYFDATIYGGDGNLYPIYPCYFLVSERTDSNSYYVYSPLYQEVVEVGDQYLTMLEWNRLDWTEKSVYVPGSLYCKSVEVAGRDENGKRVRYIFEPTSSLTIANSTAFSFYQKAMISSMSITKATYDTTLKLNPDGSKQLILNINVKYKITQESDPSNPIELTYTTKKTGSNGETINTLSINLNTVRNYCRYLNGGDSFLASLSETEREALKTYLKSSPKVVGNKNGEITVKHSLRAEADQYGLIEEKVYELRFIYNVASGKISVRMKQGDLNEGVEVFSEETVDNFVAKYVKNEEKPTFTTVEEQAIEKFRNSISSMNSNIVSLCIKTLDTDGNILDVKNYEYQSYNSSTTAEPEGNRFIRAFGKFYQTLFYTSYEGRADIADSIGGAMLTEEQMKAYIDKGDDCDYFLKVTATLDGNVYTYRMHNYSPTRTFITSNGDGQFYLLRTRAAKIFADALKVVAGNPEIDGTRPY